MKGVSGWPTPLFMTALNIGRDFPLAGSGVGSFPILARPDSPYRAPGIVDAYGAAHCNATQPVRLIGHLCRAGLVPVVALLPLATLLLVLGRAGGLCVVLLAFGLGNLVDTMWLVSGLKHILNRADTLGVR
jgi:hypothetical protein